jgi:hypothetical protein
VLSPVDQIPRATIPIHRRGGGREKVEDKTRVRALVDRLNEVINVGPAVGGLLHLPGEDMRLRDSQVKLFFNL